MTPQPAAPLPEPLRERTFTVTEAFGAGATADRLRALDLDHGVRGVRAPAGTSAELRGRCRMYAARLGPAVFVSDSTAALLLGAPLPARLIRQPGIHVTVETPARAPHATGVIGHRRAVMPGDVITDGDGLRRSSPERLVLELAGALELPDLVAVIDYLVGGRHPLTTIDQVTRRMTDGDRLSRRRILSSAIVLADPRSESRPESRLRVMATAWGLGRPVANWEVQEPRSGRLLRIDVAFVELRLALEYQSDEHHSGAAKRREDLTRRSLLEALGWTVVELNADDLRDAAELRARVHAILAHRRA